MPGESIVISKCVRKKVVCDKMTKWLPNSDFFPHKVKASLIQGDGFAIDIWTKKY